MNFSEILMVAAQQVSGTAPIANALLLSGDFSNFLLLSGDAQSGANVLLLSGTQ